MKRGQMSARPFCCVNRFDRKGRRFVDTGISCTNTVATEAEISDLIYKARWRGFYGHHGEDALQNGFLRMLKNEPHEPGMLPRCAHCALIFMCGTGGGLMADLYRQDARAQRDVAAVSVVDRTTTEMPDVVTQIWVRAAVDSLPPAQAKAVRSKYFADHDEEESGAVQTARSKGLAKLRLILAA